MSNIGRLIYGYCNGYFGRGSYYTKRIEAEGADWIVARELDPDAKPQFAMFDFGEKQEYIDLWAKKPEEEE